MRYMCGVRVISYIDVSTEEEIARQERQEKLFCVGKISWLDCGCATARGGQFSFTDRVWGFKTCSLKSHSFGTAFSPTLLSSRREVKEEEPGSS